MINHGNASLLRERHTLVASQIVDVGQSLITYARFVGNSEDPPPIDGVAAGGFPFWRPISPMLSPFGLRLDLDQQCFLLLVSAIFPRPEANKKVGGVYVRLSVPSFEGDLNRLRNDIKDGPEELGSDDEVSFQRGFVGDGGLSSKWIDAGSAPPCGSNLSSLARRSQYHLFFEKRRAVSAITRILSYLFLEFVT